ncbi:MAG: nucleotide disphospho-sugar-binding domain-containing protein, partial [Bacteroidota bacterium]
FPFQKEAEKYQWLIPVSYKTLPVLTTVLEELEFPTQNRPNLHYIGPMVYLDRKEADFTNEEIERRLDELFAEKQAGKYSKCIYWATSSILSTEISLLKRIIAVMQRNPDWLLILGMGKKLKAEQLGKLPSNVALFPFLPQLKVLAYADCCFHHGGINTLNECIHFKVPCIIYSGGVMDGPGVTARIAYHKIGIVGDANKDRTSDIEQHIQRTFSDPEILDHMERVYNAYLSSRGKGLAVVEKLLDSGQPVKI